MMRVVHVGFKQVYDLVFRARNSQLNSTAFVLDFKDWVKAGVAFNTRGFEISTRKISYFAKLYLLLKQAEEEGSEVLKPYVNMLSEALVFYYEDIFEIYQDHLKSKHAEARNSQSKSIPDLGELLILPCFDNSNILTGVFETKSYRWDEYECQNPDNFLLTVKSAYLKSKSSMFKCMSMMYDYGRIGINKGTLLEVTLWDDIK